MFPGPEYKKYLKSERWKTKRELLFLKTGKWCKACGTTYGPLNAHHMTYDRMGGEHLSDLIVLCKLCHDDLTAEWRRMGRGLGMNLRQFTHYWIKKRKRNGRRARD